MTLTEEILAENEPRPILDEPIPEAEERPPEMRARGVQAQAYHSFFRWSSQTDWTPERMGQKFVPHVIIWDEVCTVPCPTLQTFLDWLEGRGIQDIILLWRSGAAAPNRWRNATRLAPEACCLFRRGRGRPQSQKEMQARGVQAQTYHSFFRWSGQTDWTPERMGQKFVPHVIIWDEVCTVPCPTLQTFLDWLEGRVSRTSAVAIRGSPPPITREMPHDWLRGHAAYYEEVEVDHRAKSAQEANPPSARQGPVPRGGKGASWLPRMGTLHGGLEAMCSQTWRQKVCDWAQRLLSERHEYFPDTSVPLLYRPKDTQRQNIMVTIPGPLLDGRPDQQELEVPLKYAREDLDGKWGQDWALGYALAFTRARVSQLPVPRKSGS